MTPIEFPKSKVTDPFDHDDRLHSVMRGRNDFDVPPPPTIGSAEFDVEVDRFLGCRLDVASGKWPTAFFESIDLDPTPPKMFARYGVTEDDPKAASRLVDHAMDHPFDLHRTFVAEWGQPKLKRSQADDSPQSHGVDFLGWREFDAIVADNIHKALVEAFQVKYFHAYPRPEQLFESGRLVAEYGCPPHPSYVAGHGAIAGATVQTWVDHVELTPAQIAEAEHAGRQYAQYRTLAGVHWAPDNTQGYNLGVAVANA